MRKLWSVLLVLTSGLALLVFHLSAPGQDPKNLEISEINRPVSNCNDTIPSVENSKPRQDTPITPALLTSGLPCAPVLVGPFELDNLQHGFDFYSWLTFLALNSPVDGSPIGKEDKTTEWESWIQLPDVMLEDGSKPAPWRANNVIFPPACRALQGPGKIVIHMEEETYDQPFKTGPLIDQDGHYALFIILMNRPMFEYIRANNLHSITGQRAFKQGKELFQGAPNPDPAKNPNVLVDPVAKGAGIVNFPNGSVMPSGGKVGTVGSIMLKASWKILGKNDTAAEFHTKKALVFTKASKERGTLDRCVEKDVGLIGLHIVHKTSDRHQWIWTSFEHVKNVPTLDDIKAKKAKGPYNFFDPKCSDCMLNQTPPRPWHPDEQNAGDTLTFRDGYKSQIARVIPITQDANETLNVKFQNILAGTVWANYMLLSTQWPSLNQCRSHSNTRNEADPTCAPVPTYLANTTLETYSQGEIALSSSSCIACHGNATSQHDPATPSDFTFILEKARGPR